MSMDEIVFRDIRRVVSMSILPIKYLADFPFWLSIEVWYI
jgi:hypothetical protein